MAQIPTYDRIVLPDRSTGSAAISLARARSDIKAQNFESQSEQVESAAQGFINTELREAEAKNAVAVNEAMISFKRNTLDLIDRRREERASDPENFSGDFEKELKEVATDYANKLPSLAAKDAFKQSVDNKLVDILTQNKNWEKQRKTAIMAESLERSADNINTLAYRAGQGNQDIQEYLNDADASSIAASTIMAESPEKVMRVRRTMRRSALRNYLEGMTESNPGKVMEIVKSGKYDEDLDIDDIKSLNRIAEREIKHRQAEARISLEDELEDFRLIKKMGREVPETFMADLLSKTKEVGLEKEHQKLLEYSQIQEKVKDYAGKSLKEEREILTSLNNKFNQGDVSVLKEIASYEDVLATKQKMIEDGRGLEYYAAHDIIKPPTNIANIFDQQSIAQEINSRRASIEEIKKLEGIELPIFTAAELGQFKAVYQNASPKEMSSYIASISGSLKENEIKEMARAISRTTPSLSFALVADNPAISEMILSGTKAKGDVTAKDIRGEVNEEISGVFNDPEIIEQAHSAIYSYYKQLAINNGDSSNIVDRGRVRESIKAVLGEVVEVDTSKGTSKLLSYRDENNKWVDEDRLEEILTDITHDQLIKAHGALPRSPLGLGRIDIKPGEELSEEDKLRREGYYTAKQINRNVIFKTAGNGEYIGIIPGFGYVANEDGTPYIFDARKMEKAKKERAK